MLHHVALAVTAVWLLCYRLLLLLLLQGVA
jgi:hypothetical protein